MSMFAEKVFQLSLVVVVPLILFSFDRDWKKIEAFIGSKTVIQVN